MSCEDADADDDTAKLQMPRQMRPRLDTARCACVRPDTTAEVGLMSNSSTLDEMAEHDSNQRQHGRPKNQANLKRLDKYDIYGRDKYPRCQRHRPDESGPEMRLKYCLSSKST
ncbi:hypothetical protein F441_20161 [Phytophthora nicotianae CJ01A1]|uniref:Uncharacterized protein n=3 Tax=Phytophthora nicotianae TaxID=4792 RepID=W2Y7E6_PHYNI|nr:hypothetical protein F444_20283 [Phytophthora nicotianae P1976]ETP02834.1 hypothetical protein F441_20161 [Phytophthora nicotianae CJ01A1]ETP31020.1 hypothetical protein F442_20093 [Phytophthora nicotianae P10297]